MSKQITVRWVEEIAYQQTFTVEDDFDPTPPEPDVNGDVWDTEPLIELICEEGDITGAKCDWLNVNEREVDSWKWVTP